MSCRYTDRSIMPYGKLHRGKRLIDVPAEYMLFIFNLSSFDHNSALGRYIKDNMQVLKQQAYHTKNMLK